MDEPQQTPAPTSSQYTSPITLTPAPSPSPTPSTPPTSPVPSAVVPPPSGGMGSKMVVGTLIAVIVVLGFAYYFLVIKHGSGTVASPLPVASASAIVSASPTATIDPTANWQTYSNTQLGFSFSIPSTWTVSPSDNTTVTAVDTTTTYTGSSSATYHPAIYVQIQPDTYDSSITSYEMRMMNPAVRATRQTQTAIVGGKTAYVYTGTTPPTGQDFRVIFTNGSVYVITSTVPLVTSEQGTAAGSKLAEIFARTLSSFQFTTPVSTTDWKTYTSDALNIAFKYPSDWTVAEKNDFPGSAQGNDELRIMKGSEVIYASAKRDCLEHSTYCKPVIAQEPRFAWPSFSTESTNPEVKSIIDTVVETATHPK